MNLITVYEDIIKAMTGFERINVRGYNDMKFYADSYEVLLKLKTEIEEVIKKNQEAEQANMMSEAAEQE